ncbi:MAG: hypothetical protein KatS3mg105_1938 [Gemmatales bacterium]|nr:MAG: hypothetical protein KatS3mg105_1938 [Gemmatales bacterium]
MAEMKYDPYALSADAIVEPPPSLGAALRKIGPGLILAGSIVGTGELIATTNVGAKAGFVLLWLVLLSCFIKVFVQIELGRYAVSSGQTTLSGFRSLPGVGRPILWWWLVMVLVTQTQIGAMLGGVAYALHLAIPVIPDLTYQVIICVVTAAMLVTGSYRLIERFSITLVATFSFLTLACVALLPWTGHAFSWGDISSGFSFQIPNHAVGAAFAMFGITGVGATELISYPYWCIEKGYARNVGPREDSESWYRRARGWLRVMKLDAWASLVVYTTATLAFYFLGAAVLHERVGDLPDTAEKMLHALAQMYEPVMGPKAATWFIVVGAFATLYSTFFAAIASNSRVLTDFLHVANLTRFSKPEDRVWWVRVLSVALVILGFVLFQLMEKPVLMVTIGGFMQAVTLPIIAGAAMFFRYRRTDPRLVSGRLWDVFLVLSSLALLLTAAYGIADQLSKVWSAR